MTVRLWLGALGLTIAGLMLAGGMTVSLAGGPSSPWVLLGAVTLGAASLPFVVRESAPRRPRLAVAGTVAVVCGHVLVMLFNLQILLLIADWVGLWALETTMAVGRKAVPLVIGGGLVMLAAAWSRAENEVPVRVGLVVVGVPGVLLAFQPEGRPQMAWYLALGALWLFFGLAAWLDARQPVHA